MNDGAWAKAQPGYTGPNGATPASRLTDGVSAMCKLLTSYIDRGFDTPRKIANRWAPASDGNDSLAYAKAIAAAMHIGLDDKLHHADGIALTLVQARIENAGFPKAWMSERQRRNGPAKAVIA